MLQVPSNALTTNPKPSITPNRTMFLLVIRMLVLIIPDHRPSSSLVGCFGWCQTRHPLRRINGKFDKFLCSNDLNCVMHFNNFCFLVFRGLSLSIRSAFSSARISKRKRSAASNRSSKMAMAPWTIVTPASVAYFPNELKTN